MNRTFSLAAALFFLAAGTAQAQFADAPPARGSQHRAMAASQVTCAELQADLQVYRESGLATLEANEAAVWHDDAHRAAQARYAELRSSPYFATLVQRYAGNTAQRMALARR